MSLLVLITAEDIATAKRGNPRECVVARAATRAARIAEVEFGHIEVTTHRVNAYRKQESQSELELLAAWSLGEAGRKVVADFDNNRKFEPCTLTLERCE